MSDNIVNFKDFKEKKNAPSLDALRRTTLELSSIYEILEQAYKDLNTMEEVIGNAEYSFEKAVTDYAKEVGAEQVPLDILSYCKGIVVKVDADGYSVTLEHVE